MGGFLGGLGEVGGSISLALSAGELAAAIGGILGGHGGSIYAPTQIISGREFTATSEQTGQSVTFRVPPNSLYGLYTIDQLNQMIRIFGLATAIAMIGAEISSGTNPGSVAPGIGGGAEDTINVNNTIQIGADVGAAIGDAVAQAIGASQAISTNAINALGDKISSSIGDISHVIGDGIANAFTGLGDSIGKILSNISGALANAFGGIFGGVKDVLAGIGDVLKGLVAAVKDHISQLVQAIKDNGAAALLPVIQAVATEIANVRNIIAAIQTDLHAGMGALLLVPRQIADAATSIDATLERALSSIGFKQGTKIDSGITLDDSVVPDSFIKSFAGILAPDGAPADVTPLLRTLHNIVEPCTNLDAQTFFNEDSEFWTKGPFWAQWLFKVALNTIDAFYTLAAIKNKRAEAMEQEVNKRCPIKELSPNDALEAWLRDIIDDGVLKNELAQIDYPATRVEIMKQLLVQRLPEAMLTDGWFKGVVNDADLQHGMKVLGYTPAQVKVIQTISQHFHSVTELLRLRNFKTISDETFRGEMAKLRYTPEQTDLLLRTYQTPETTAALIQADGLLTVNDLGWLPVTGKRPTPQRVLDAAQRDQITDGAARLAWLQHYRIPNWSVILQSYFRNLRTQNDVHLAMTHDNVPEEFWDELIKISRPLIPFRSIPRFVQQGVMSEADAVLELSSHGYDPVHIRWILEASTKTANKTAATAVKTAGALSISTAKTLFDDGVFTRDQYIQVLEQHGFTPDVALLQAEAEEIHAHVRARKQQIQDLVDEVLTGVLSLDDAISRLQKSDFTIAEIARFQREVQRGSTQKIKRPTISQLKNWFAGQLLSRDAVENELRIQGWTSPFVEFILLTDFPGEPDHVSPPHS